MHLSPHEQERLLLSYAAELARRRRARGLWLNLAEATALITDHVIEAARDGVLVAELMHSGRTVLTSDDVDRAAAHGGWVTTAWGDELHRVTASAEALAGPTGCRVPA